MREFKISKNPYKFDRAMYPKASFIIHPGVTVLVGCNGSGKTTMLRNIEADLRKTKTPYMKYSDMVNGRDHANSHFDFYGDMRSIASNFVSSEGECIHNNFGRLFVTKVRRFAFEHKDDNELWFLLDALDSGTSIDMIREFKDIFQLILEDQKNCNIYIVIAANSFEMARDYDCLLMRTFEHVRFDDYNKYAEEIMKSKEKKDKRFKESESKKED